MIKHILVCTDGSPYAVMAARAAAELARLFQAEITLLACYDMTAATIPFANPADPMPQLGVSMDMAFATIEGATRPAAEALDALGVRYTKRHAFGPIPSTIVDTAQELGVDLIVLGGHGATRLESALLGSVCNGVTLHAHCPVLVVHSDTLGLKRVMAAADGSECSLKALDVAARLVHAAQGELEVVTVVPEHGTDAGTQLVDDALVQRIRHVAERAGTEYTLYQETGQRAEAITARANANLAGLLVIGSRGHGALHNLPLGSTSSYVVHHVHGSVLIVR